MQIPRRSPPGRRRCSAALLSLLLIGACTQGEDERVEFTASPATKICQLTGEHDAQLDTPTANRTLSRYDLWGTDLGSSFEHDGKLWFLFGDSLTANPRVDTLSSGKENPVNGDAIAFTSDTDPGDCVSLEFLTHPNGAFRSPAVPGVNHGALNVPLDGISTGQAMYVWFSIDKMTGSVLAGSDDDADTFSLTYEFSTSRFINVSADVLSGATIPGLGDAGRTDWVLLFGSGKFRGSDVYLAAVPVEAIERLDAVRFFAGLDDGNVPTWAPSEAEAVPVFESEDHPSRKRTEGCVGELSVHHSEVADAWLALYNCAGVRIVLRASAVPWSTWSDPVTVFNPARHGGFCEFIHASWKKRECDSVHDSGKEGEGGAVYGPYVMERYTTGDSEQAELYFVMSTWNPYNVVVMATTLQRRA